MRIDIFTLFPEMFESPFRLGIFQRAVEQGLVALNTHNIRDYTHDKHHTVDDYPYGGGAGMVMRPDPIYEAVETVKAGIEGKRTPVILLTPQGRLFNQSIAMEYSRYSNLMLVCGHYEGFDERIREHLAADELSIGDYILTGGEFAAMVVTDAVVRLIPGVLGSEESLREDSHMDGLLEYPHYTRPPVFREWAVPDVLLSGNHREIARWRREQAIRRTFTRRPDLLDKAELSRTEKDLVQRLKIIT